MKIKPCPKCGSDNVDHIVDKSFIYWGSYNEYYICKDCNLSCPASYEDFYKLIWNMLSDYANQSEFDDETNLSINALKKEVAANYYDIQELKKQKSDVEYYKEVYKDMITKYYALEERLSKLEDSKPVGIAWFNEVYGDLYKKLCDIEKLGKKEIDWEYLNRQSSFDETPKPIDECIVFKCPKCDKNVTGRDVFYVHLSRCGKSKKEKEPKPVNEACLYKECLFKYDEEWKKSVLLGIGIIENKEIYFASAGHGLFPGKMKCGHIYTIRMDEAKRCPDVKYGDEDD